MQCLAGLTHICTCTVWWQDPRSYLISLPFNECAGRIVCLMPFSVYMSAPVDKPEALPPGVRYVLTLSMTKLCCACSHKQVQSSTPMRRGGCWVGAMRARWTFCSLQYVAYACKHRQLFRQLCTNLGCRSQHVGCERLCKGLRVQQDTTTCPCSTSKMSRVCMVPVLTAERARH